MHCITGNEDNDCIRRCLEGDADAFEGLVVKYQKPVFNAIYHMVQNREDASEILQAVFLKAYLNLKSFDTSRKFFSWIYRIAMNDSINFVSSRHQSEPIDPMFQSDDATPEEDVETRELARLLDQEIAKLPAEQRAVVILRHISNLSYEEIAEALQIPEKTVKSRLFDARQRLRVAFLALGYRRSSTHA